MALTHENSGTLGQQLLPQRGALANEAVRNGVLVVAGSLFVALCAQIRVPLPFTPVPLSGQTLGVLLVGGLLGPRLGLLSLLLYLVQGAVGLPVFADSKAGLAILLGPTAGYLVGFPLAAALTGYLASLGWDRRFLSTLLAMVLGNLVIYFLGAGWLAFGMGMGVSKALVLGVVPFLIGDALKAVLAAVALPSGWRLLGKE